MINNNKRFYIFRHGQTFATKYHTGYGWKVFSADILDEGKEELARLGKYLKDVKTDYNVSSRIKRCRQTAQIISDNSGKNFSFDKRLNEFFLETYGNLKRRINSFLEDLEKEGYESVLICTHGAVMNVMVNILTVQNLKLSNLFIYPDPGTLLIIEDGKLKDIKDFRGKESTF
jgi:broad specificity phosphatase PhoE